MLAEDLKVREYLKARLKSAAVSRILIERPAKNARITIFSARPGVGDRQEGRGHREPEGRLTQPPRRAGAVNIEEVRKPESMPQLIADSITQQLEKRIMFRRAMKRAMQNAMRLGAQGIKIMSSGRLNGIEIARCEWYREGRVPLHTLKADIDYGFSEAKTTYGVIGVKCWVYRGDRLATAKPRRAAPAPKKSAVRAVRPSGRPGERRGPSRPGRGGDRRAAPGRRAGRGARQAGRGRWRAPKGPAVKRVRKAAAPARAAKENKQCCNPHAENSARNRRAATPASPRAAPTCRSATSASRPPSAAA
jgi:small subunit ribosomal protein S3